MNDRTQRLVAKYARLSPQLQASLDRLIEALADSEGEARAAVAAGASHDCQEWWNSATGRCALCDRARPV